MSFLISHPVSTVVSPEYTSLVTPALTDVYFTTNVAFGFKASLSKMVSDGVIWLPYLDSATSNL